MGKNTSVSLGDHYESFVNEAVNSGKYASASEVIRAGLRMLEEHEHKYQALSKALKEGEESGYNSLDEYEIPEWQKNAVRNRLENHKKNPHSLKDIDDALDDIEKQL